MWPEPVERVAAYLRRAGAEARLEELRPGDDPAEALGCAAAQVAEVHAYDGGGRLVVALAPAGRRVDPSAVAAAVGTATARPAPPAAAPFPLPATATVLVDRALLGHGVVWVPAGSPRHRVGLAPAELLRLARARAADLARE